MPARLCIVGAVMDIVVWLRSLGRGKYEAVFRENEIDLSVLLDKTDQDLEKQRGRPALSVSRLLRLDIARSNLRRRRSRPPMARSP